MGESVSTGLEGLGKDDLLLASEEERRMPSTYSARVVDLDRVAALREPLVVALRQNLLRKALRT